MAWARRRLVVVAIAITALQGCSEESMQVTQLQDEISDLKSRVAAAAKAKVFNRPTLEPQEARLQEKNGDPKNDCACLGYEHMNDDQVGAIMDLGLDPSTGSYCAAWDDEQCVEQKESSGQLPHRCGKKTVCAAAPGDAHIGDQSAYRWPLAEAAPFCCMAWCWVNPKCNGAQPEDAGLKRSAVSAVPELQRVGLVYSYWACRNYQSETMAGKNFATECPVLGLRGIKNVSSTAKIATCTADTEAQRADCEKKGPEKCVAPCHPIYEIKLVKPKTPTAILSPGMQATGMRQTASHVEVSVTAAGFEGETARNELHDRHAIAVGPHGVHHSSTPRRGLLVEDAPHPALS